jgi:hypothetical protein
VINDGMGSSLRNHKQNPIQTPALPQIFKCDSPAPVPDGGEYNPDDN